MVKIMMDAKNVGNYITNNKLGKQLALDIVVMTLQTLPTEFSFSLTLVGHLFS